MSDILLFKINKNNAIQLIKSYVYKEKNIQKLIENNLDTFFGIEFLATEYYTENNEGRIDTLGIDEDGSPVIIEYKKTMEKGMLEQILSYYAWLDKHRLEFEKVVEEQRKKSKIKCNKNVDWTSPRLLCIAEDFNNRLLKAATQIPQKVQFIRFQMYEKQFLIFELMGAKRTKARKSPEVSPKKGAELQLDKSSEQIKNLFFLVDSYLINLGEDVNKKILKQYFAYSKIRNFASLKVLKNSIKIYLYTVLSKKEHISNITRDVTTTGHHGTGNLEVEIESKSDFERVKHLIEKAYLSSKM